jgi:LPXTG-motif cell wall-anchored protein
MTFALNTRTLSVVRGAPWRRGRVRVLGSAGVVALTALLSLVPAVAAQAAVPLYQVGQQVQMPGAGFGGDVEVDPARGLVYVPSRGSDAVYVYDEATLTLQDTIAVPDDPYGLAIGPTGLVYVTQQNTVNSTQGFVSVIDPATNTIVATVDAGLSPVGVTVSHDGARLFVGNNAGDYVSVFSLADPAAPTPLPNIAVPTGADQITESADGSTLFVATTDAVAVVDARTGAPVALWPGLPYPHEVMLSADGVSAFVSLQQGTDVPIFSVATDTQSGAIPGANTYFQSTDTVLGAGFVTRPWADGGSLIVIDSTTGAVLQTLTGTSAGMHVATDSTTHATFVVSGNSNTLTKVTPVGLTVDTNPTDQSVADGDSMTVTASATGSPPITTQWQTSTDVGATWTDIAGATGTTYSRPVVFADSGTLFRAVFTDPIGLTATSTAATLTVLPDSAVIVTHPEDQTVAIGDTATFTAVPRGTEPITVQWQSSRDHGASWADVTDATDATFTTPPTVQEDSGTLYRAVFTGPGTNHTATTDAAALTVTGTAPSPSPSPSPPSPSPETGDLAHTGADIPIAIAALGALAAAAGTGLILLRRRRTRG